MKPKHKTGNGCSLLLHGLTGFRVSCFTYFDFANVMSYDSTGPWNPEHLVRLRSLFDGGKAILIFWAAERLPQNETSLGVPSYGWNFFIINFLG